MKYRVVELLGHQPPVFRVERFSRRWFIEKWRPAEEMECGWGDCEWIVEEFRTLREACDRKDFYERRDLIDAINAEARWVERSCKG